MKSRKIIFTTVLSALVCFGLCQQVQSGTDTPDPGPLPITNTADGQLALPGATGTFNSAFGIYALLSNGAASLNTGVGAGALFSNTADSNTATGAGALFSNTTASGNTATGTFALFTNTEGIGNTAIGNSALLNNTTGNFNTANGNGALLSNTTGIENTATGSVALLNNTTGSFNTATGSQALVSNTEGGGNTAHGHAALGQNTTGNQNTACGDVALFSNTTGFFNMASGANALQDNTEGIGNTGAGNAALIANTTGLQNTACGNAALFESTTGFLNTALGMAAGDFTTGDNNVLIGNLGVAAESDTIRIGMEVAADDEFGIPHPAHTATYIAGISGQTAAGGVAVVIDSDGKLGTLTSSARFKTEIKPMDESSTAVLALKPVTFRYKHEIDPKGIPQFGLVAEEVAKVNPDLVIRDRNGEIYSVRYEAVNVMLLNEFLKAHRRMEEQDKRIEELTAQLKQQAAQIQKVSAQLEASKPATQVVNNP
jgi:trimeric autotransporter adhesin